jgi:hypothetical protein
MAVFVKRRASKVDDSDFVVQRHSASQLPADIPVELEIIRGVHQQDILRLQVRVHDVQAMEEVDRDQELPGKVLHDIQREGAVTVAAHEVIEGRAKLFKHDADVPMVIKPVLQVDTAALAGGVVLGDGVEHLELHAEAVFQHVRAIPRGMLSTCDIARLVWHKASCSASIGRQSAPSGLPQRCWCSDGHCLGRAHASKHL